MRKLNFKVTAPNGKVYDTDDYIKAFGNDDNVVEISLYDCNLDSTPEQIEVAEAHITAVERYMAQKRG